MPKLEPRVLCAPSPLLTQLKVLAHGRAHIRQDRFRCLQASLTQRSPSQRAWLNGFRTSRSCRSRPRHCGWCAPPLGRVFFNFSAGLGSVGELIPLAGEMQSLGCAHRPGRWFREPQISS